MLMITKTKNRSLAFNIAQFVLYYNKMLRMHLNDLQHIPVLFSNEFYSIFTFESSPTTRIFLFFFKSN